jgi:hypothetical protein
LHALSCASLGPFLQREQLRIALALRLGARMCVPHRCRLCDSVVDEFGLHGLSCRRSSGRFPGHHALNDILRRALVSAGVPSIWEPVGVCGSDGKRPDGMTQIPWKEGKCLVCNLRGYASSLSNSTEQFVCGRSLLFCGRKETYLVPLR